MSRLAVSKAVILMPGFKLIARLVLDSVSSRALGFSIVRVKLELLVTEPSTAPVTVLAFARRLEPILVAPVIFPPSA